MTATDQIVLVGLVAIPVTRFLAALVRRIGTK